MKIQIFSILFATSLAAFSKPAVKTNDPDLKSIFSKLRESPMVTFDVEKKTKSELLGKETVSPGTIYVSAKKFRWDTEGLEKSKIIYDGKVIWTIQEPPKGFKAAPQITKMKLDKKTESQVFLNSLFQENFDSQFKMTKRTKVDNSWDFVLKPVQKNLGIDQVSIKVNDKNEIKEIAYVDEIQNKITIEINKTSLSKKSNPQLFQFKPPTGAQVNEL
jgi:chaperone LolA